MIVASRCDRGSVGTPSPAEIDALAVTLAEPDTTT